MGHNRDRIRKRPSGNYQVNWIDPTGKRRAKTLPTHGEAKRFLALVDAQKIEIEHGIRRALPDKGFDDLVDLWERVKGPVKKSIQDDRSRIDHHLRPVLAGLPVRAIGHDHWITIRNSVAEGRSRATVIQVLALLRAMLNLAFKHGWLAERPNFDMPKAEDQPYAYLETWDDVVALVRAARATDYPGLAELYATACLTGLRAGELAGLRWSDLNADMTSICVQRSFRTTTKSGKVRYVPVPPSLRRMLQAWRLQCPSRELVLPNKVGNMHASASRPFNRLFKRCLADAGLPEIKFHDLRHTFASHWMTNGGDLFRLQKVLGHASTKMTLRYAHLSPTTIEADIGVLPDLDAADPAGEVIPLPANVAK